MSGVQQIEIRDEDADQRLDRWFKRHFPALGHGRLEKLLRTGQVRIDGKRAQASDRIEAGNAIRIPPLPNLDTPPPPRPKPVIDEKEAQALRKLVLYRDADMLAIDKPAGLAVQGGSKTIKHLDGMLAALQFDAPEPPRLVHRLDRDTSGVLLLARNRKAASDLTALFRSRDMRKIYWAVVVGRPEHDEGDIRLALAKRIGRPGEGEERMVVDEDPLSRARQHRQQGQPARTRAIDRPHAPVAGALPGDRHADPGRRQIWRQGCVHRGRAAGQSVAFAGARVAYTEEGRRKH
jgi:23S rRNA pseudouridine955/2504/2580 synthase